MTTASDAIEDENESMIDLTVEEEPQPAAAGRWQYLVVRKWFGQTLEDELNRLGEEGWELVAITGIDGAVTSLTGNKLFAVMKRPWRPPPPEPEWVQGADYGEYDKLATKWGSSVFRRVWAEYCELPSPPADPERVLASACEKVAGGARPHAAVRAAAQKATPLPRARG